MKPLRLVVAFALFTICTVFCLWGIGVIQFAEASDTLRRVLLVVGAVGIAASGAFFVMGGRKSAPAPSSESKLNSGPKF